MKIIRMSSLVLISLLGIALLLGPVSVAQDLDPESIYRAAYDAFNAGDLEGGMALVADDVVGVVLPPPPGVAAAQIGMEQFGELVASSMADNAHWELDNFQVNGETATYTAQYEADDFMADFDIYPLEFEGFVVVRDGLIHSEVWSMTAESRADIDALMAKIADEEVVLRWLNHWDTVNGELEGIEEILAEDFISHNMPEGDRDVMVADVAAFRADNPNIYFEVDELVIEDGKAFLLNHMMNIPEDAAEGAEGEQVSPQFLTVLNLKDGQITERWLFAPLE